MQPEIRRYRPDAEILRSLLSLERRNFSKADSWASILEKEAQRRNTVLLYAVREEQVIAYCIFTVTKLTVHLSKVAVDKPHRRQGIARTLIQESLRLCKAERGVQCATLHVDPSNEAARTLYQRLGFRIDAVLQDYYAPGRPAWKMLLDLCPNSA